MGAVRIHLLKERWLKKNKLSYDANGYYVDKDGQTYGISENGHVTKRKYKYTNPNSYSHPDNVLKQVKFKAKEVWRVVKGMLGCISEK